MLRLVWGVRFLDDPGEAGLRLLGTGLGQRRHVVNHIAERGSLDEQHFRHEILQIFSARYTQP
jgi:hypothetical protein